MTSHNAKFSDESKVLPKEVITTVGVLALRHKTKRFVEVFIDRLWLASVHEVIHEVAPRLTERQVERAACYVLAVQKNVEFMPWTEVVCPKTNRVISLRECFNCNNRKKHYSCPTLFARVRIIDRWGDRQQKRYSLTDLIAPRQAFFRYKIGYSQTWDETTDMKLGRAIHDEETSGYTLREIGVTKSFGDFSVSGRVDAVDILNGTLWEYKTWASLDMLFDSKPKAKLEDLWQACAYYEMLQSTDFPFSIFYIALHYIGRARGRRQKWREGTVFHQPMTTSELVNSPGFRERCHFSPVDLSLRQRARLFHEAFKLNIPPSKNTCLAWDKNVSNAKWRCRRCSKELRKECAKYP